MAKIVPSKICWLREERYEFTDFYDTILKESIRFRAEKENSFIQKIKLL